MLSLLSSLAAKTFDYARIDEGDAPRLARTNNFGRDLYPRVALVAVLKRDPGGEGLAHFPSPRWGGWPEGPGGVTWIAITPPRRFARHLPQSRGRRGRVSSLPRPVCRSGHCKPFDKLRMRVEDSREAGQQDRTSLILYVARFPVPRQCSCPTAGGAGFHARVQALGQGPDLSAHHLAAHRHATDPAPALPLDTRCAPSFPWKRPRRIRPLDDQPGTVPATLIRSMTRVPVQEFGAWIKIFLLNEFKGLAKQSRKSAQAWS